MKKRHMAIALSLLIPLLGGGAWWRLRAQPAEASTPAGAAVSVTERTREIGVRKAIGAKDRDNLRQFLLESIVMSVLGGLIGVAVGFGVARIVALATELTPVVKVQRVLISMSFSAAVGYYPARRAARLRPIDALRYE